MTFDSGRVSTDEARPHLVEMLDSLRRQREQLAASIPRYITFAANYGLRPAEIADVLGMSESGVRKVIRRAKESPQ
ncbi:hypothetical protein IU436_20265 [Nocardia farcinica]|uniref:hypothetical protein n=1 Tax=Nocardia farcinica TaxID=37329 RepID=UPI0018931139|nr:hypothetical protein [Nocardia farcinica]MBF6363185.1 hypothetical protein [Nocardia farcinica]MBF6420848.1 hypothetical protein [Nocardia farcinica]MBF6432693.1 hypothetical protein [Nocardia farcinica]MBF6503192.1 hypothetical protein [Nocardia farcinica]